MDTAPIKSALTELEKDLELARDARYQIECEKAHRRPVGGGGGWEDPEGALPSVLNGLHETLLVVLEAAGLLHARQQLLDKWAEFEKKGGIGKTDFDPQNDYLESKPFSYIERLVNNLRNLAGDGLAPGDSQELAMLETILRKTPVLVRNLKAAIEFKFADAEEEVTKAIGGIFEDMSGYAGSLDWTRFYTVIYQTKAFESEDRVRSEVTRAGAVMKWTAILVTGAGKRRRKKQPKP